MADAFASLLVDTFTAQAYAMAADGSGGVTKTWSDQSTGIAGMFARSSLRGIEANVGASQQSERRWLITLAKGTTIEEANRLVQTHSSGVAITARYFQIEQVYAGDSFASSVVCECIELPNLNQNG